MRWSNQALPWLLSTLCWTIGANWLVALLLLFVLIKQQRRMELVCRWKISKNLKRWVVVDEEDGGEEKRRKKKIGFYFSSFLRWLERNWQHGCWKSFLSAHLRRRPSAQDQRWHVANRLKLDASSERLFCELTRESEEKGDGVSVTMQICAWWI